MQATIQPSINQNTPQFIWLLRRLLRRLKLQGLVALLLIALAFVLLIFGILPMQANIDNLHQALLAKPSKPVLAETVSPQQSAEQDLISFQNRFPGVNQLADELDVLFRLAEGHGLTIDKGEYTLVEKSQGSLRRFEATLPLTGNYPQVQALVMDVLDKLPAVAVADVSFERENIAQNQVKANLRFVFFIRKISSGNQRDSDPSKT